MRLRSITIGRLPGIPERLRVEGLSAGINFITGPNASGKSSIIRALRYLLTPRQKTDPVDLILEAEFEIDGVAWSVARTSQDPVWRRAGEIVSPPNLPQADAMDAHLIRIEDLLALEKGRDEALANTLRIEIDGGFNLREIKEHLEGLVRTSAKNERAAVEKTRDELNRIKNQHRALAQQQANLPSIDQAIAEAEQAQSEVSALKISIEVVGFQSKLKSLDERASELPQALAQLTGQELNQLNALEASQNKWQQAEQSLNETLAQQRSALEASGLEKKLPSPSIIRTAEAFTQRLTTLLRDLEAHNKTQSLVITRLEQARQRLDPTGTHPPDQWPRLTVDDINQAQRLARAMDRAHQQSLSTSPSHPSANSKKWWAAIALGTTLGILGIALNQTNLTAVILIGLAVLALFQWRQHTKLPKNTGLSETPQAFELEQEAEALAQKLGFQPALLGEQAGLVFADAYRQFETAHNEYLEIIAKREHDEKSLSDLIQQINTLLSPFGWADCEPSYDPAALITLQATLSDWLERAHGALSLTEKMEGSERQLQQAQHEISTVWQQVEAIYQKAGLLPEQKTHLETILSQKPLWDEIIREQQTTQTLLDDRRTQLADRPDLIALIEQGSVDKLDQQLKQYQQAAEGLGALQEARAQLKNDIKHASNGHDLTRANAARERANEQLIEKRQAVLLAEAELFWLEHIEQETQQVSGERVYDLASTLFASFTHHQWEMRLSEGFYAIRTKDQARMALSELSTATRMQLLLAVRIARMLKSEEQHERLPLFIDEALTTSDPHRAATIIDNLQTIASDEGRQIIYLAASDYELQLWHHLTQQTPTLIQLDQDAPVKQDDALALSFSAKAAIPTPDAYTEDEYAKVLGIQPWMAHQPVESLHLYYVLADDLELLHRLMDQWRLQRLGAFERWLTSPSGQQQLDAEKIATLKTRCQLIRRWWALWHRGRPIPMDEAVIHRATEDGGLTQTTLPGVLEAARHVNFDANKLLAFLKEHPIDSKKSSRKLSQKKWGELAQYLEDRGHVSLESSMALEDIRMRALETLHDSIALNELHALQGIIDRLEQGQPRSSTQ